MNSYASVTTLKSDAYLDVEATTNDAYLRGLLEAASRMIDDYTGRYFYTYEGTKYFDGAGTTLWTPDILSITTLKTDENDDATYENTLTENTDFYLLPYNDTVKTRAVIRSGGSYGSFASGIKKSVEIDGVFGYGNGESTTPYFDSGDDLAAAITSTTATTTTVDDDGNFAIGQTIRIDTEQMYISAITASSETLTIERGINGTDAATHLIAATIYIYEYPQRIKEACLIQCMRWWARKDSAFADVMGVPELGTVIAKKGLDPDIQMLINPYVRYR